MQQLIHMRTIYCIPPGTISLEKPLHISVKYFVLDLQNTTDMHSNLKIELKESSASQN